MVVFNDGEWVTLTSQGYYVASAGGEKYINVVRGMEATSIEPYRAQFNRPDLVQAVLQQQAIDTIPPRIILYPKQRLVQNTLVIDTYSIS